MKKLECTNLQGAKADAPRYELEGPEPPDVRATTTVRVTVVKEFMTDAQWKAARQRPGAVATGDLDKDAIMAAEAFSEVLEAGELVAVTGYLTVATAGLHPVLAASGAHGRFFRVLAKERSSPDVPVKWIKRFDDNSIDYFSRVRGLVASMAPSSNACMVLRNGGGNNLGVVGVDVDDAMAVAARKPPPKRKNPFEAIDPGSNGGDCGYRALAAGWALLGDVAKANRETTLQPAKLERMAKTLRAQLALRIDSHREYFEDFWTHVPMRLDKEDGDIPTTWEEYVKANNRPKRWIDGLSCQAACDHFNRHIYTYTGVGNELKDVNWVDKVTWFPTGPDAQRTALLQPALHVGLWRDHCYILLPDDGERHKKETKRPNKQQIEERIQKACRHSGSPRKADAESDSEDSWMTNLARTAERTECNHGHAQTYAEWARHPDGVSDYHGDAEGTD
ncbi:unnamed protein product [Prorocentrum cordatum]|uniref:OTU domain-containing protein n=1 Tax=Prorocentrum cordatum TaxID=2364126 RepID=A0ABN9VHX6_9DINO|nr:unnamed protein product [Polarella glacialis]